MELSVRNIGLVEEANIKLEGLTIIAGENDTGKSTIGKTIFAIIKGMNSHHKDFIEDKILQFEDITEKIYFAIRRLSRNIHIEAGEDVRYITVFNKVSKNIHPPMVKRKILSYLNLEDYEGLEKYIMLYTDDALMAAKDLGIPMEEIGELDSLIAQLEMEVKASQDPQNYIIRSIMFTLRSEFGTDLCNKFTKKLSEIKYDENGEVIFKASLKNNNIRKASYSITPLEIEDVTYIESPLIFQMHKMILETNIFQNERKVLKGKDNKIGSIPFHMKDLISKMSNSTYYEFDLKSENLNFVEQISNIIEGNSIFDKDTDEFLFERSFHGETYSFNTSNVASGIKSFSMIQMLLKAQVINQKSILILDEPENHLHPKWQIKYCEIIVKLVSMGVRVVINSHSPYIIQALKVLANKYEINDSVNFYLAEKDIENQTTMINNVNDDLNSVFKKLSDPLQNLVWEQ
ncbi:AAA family ATPase [Bacillus thuringiensis]|uniref:AAA family ATPase n=1 Tax=Bacillus thuringiensis TaxID=1428 RepID=UPI002D80799F|nr:AAA family ATPase [Bacillus thuringiensis]MEB4819592.1 AAA family ATPase [Bacillus thuringiensis]